MGSPENARSPATPTPRPAAPSNHAEPPGAAPAPSSPPGECDDRAPDPVERELVDRARGGERDAFATLVSLYQEQVLRTAHRVLRCDRAFAEDMCQEVFMRVFRGLPQFAGDVRFAAWLQSIALNTCITEYRKRKAMKRRRTTLSIDQPVAGTDDLRRDPPSREVEPSVRAHHREFSVAVREAVAELPDEFRAAVMLRDLQGMSYEEIGGVLGVPPGTVRSRIHRGRLQLQEMLREYL